MARWHKDTNASKASTGTPNAYVFAADQTLSAYYDGLEIAFDANFTNTGAATLNVDAVAAATIKKNNDQDLAAGDIEAGQKVIVIYDGTNWQLISPTAQASAGTGVANVFTADQTIQSTDAGAGTGPLLILDRESASPAAADNLGEVVFRGESSTGADIDYAGVRGELVDPTNANPDGEVIIETNVAGTKGAALHVGQGVYTPGATGGDPGADGINASGLYVDNTQVFPLEFETEAAASGTAVSFTGIRATATRITILLNGLSTSGSDNLLVQIGDSGGFETTGYASGAGDAGNSAVSTAGFILTGSNAGTALWHGHVTLILMDGSTKWVSSGAIGRSDTASNSANTSGGTKSLSATLDRVRVTVTGANTFDAGNINIVVE